MQPKTTTAKAWVTLLALIVASITASGILPVAGTAHTVWTIASIIVGTLATYFTRNRVIEGEFTDDAV